MNNGDDNDDDDDDSAGGRREAPLLGSILIGVRRALANIVTHSSVCDCVDDSRQCPVRLAARTI
jgi:hypothetical protein